MVLVTIRALLYGRLGPIGAERATGERDTPISHIYDPHEQIKRILKDV